jgi:regulation of enolase protein 1 (concanavalin A-like superfamily)
MIDFKSSNLFLGACLLSVSSFSAYSAQDSKTEKPITVKSIPYEMRIDNQLGEVKVSNEQIEITALKGTDLFSDTTGAKNTDNTPRLLFLPEGDFIFSAKVSAKFGETPYDGGALIVYADSKNWGKLLFERFKSGKIGIATTVSKGSGDDAYHGTRDTNYQYLKIVRHDSSYIFYTSQDGKDWNFVRHFELKSATPVHIGFTAQALLAENFTASFSDIKYRAGKFTNFWQGE